MGGVGEMNVVERSRLHFAATCLVIVFAAIACAEAVCPAGTTDMGGHCVPQSGGGSVAVDSAAAATPSNSASAAAGMETRSDANLRDPASGNVSGGSGQSTKPPEAGAGVGGANAAGAEAPPRGGRGAETSTGPTCGNGKIEGTELC